VATYVPELVIRRIGKSAPDKLAGFVTGFSRRGSRLVPTMFLEKPVVTVNRCLVAIHAM
jgi:hypothetical protein